MATQEYSNESQEPGIDSTIDGLDNGTSLLEVEKQYYEPTHIWYAATVFPLCSACFGPMASAFNLCALIEDWRVTVPNDGVEADEMAIADPRW